MVSKVRGTFDTFKGRSPSPRTGARRCAPRSTSARSTPRTRSATATSGSADFFDADNHPTATFVSTSVSGDNGDYVLTGDFIAARRHPDGLDAAGVQRRQRRGQGEVAGFEASIELNRKDFGISIDMPLETGGTVVGDKVTITLEIEAVKAA